jgi:hypothetical protein
MTAATTKTLTVPTKADLLQVRAIGRAIAKKHGSRISVKKGTGSIKHTINVGGWDNKSVEARIEFGEAMLAAGFDMSWGHSMTLENHYLHLARQHGHSSFCVLLMKVAN